MAGWQSLQTTFLQIRFLRLVNRTGVRILPDLLRKETALLNLLMNERADAY
jgi:hypothetical protein